jgi:hypothetical protein
MEYKGGPNYNASFGTFVACSPRGKASERASSLSPLSLVVAFSYFAGITIEWHGFGDSSGELGNIVDLVD